MIACPFAPEHDCLIVCLSIDAEQSHQTMPSRAMHQCRAIHRAESDRSKKSNYRRPGSTTAEILLCRRGSSFLTSLAMIRVHRAAGDNDAFLAAPRHRGRHRWLRRWVHLSLTFVNEGCLIKMPIGQKGTCAVHLTQNNIQFIHVSLGWSVSSPVVFCFVYLCFFFVGVHFYGHFFVFTPFPMDCN